MPYANIYVTSNVPIASAGDLGKNVGMNECSEIIIDRRVEEGYGLRIYAISFMIYTKYKCKMFVCENCLKVFNIARQCSHGR